MNDILTAFLTVSAIAAVAGVLLSLISHFFAVEEDPRKKELRALLPGVNCGACGYKSCDDYAAALAEGRAKANLCVPGAESVAGAVADYLGIAAEPVKDVVAFVHCNGTCEATFPKTDYVGVADCRAAATLYGGPGACHYGCIGLGDCAAACPSSAICMKDGIAHVDTSLCIGCGLCVSTCPHGIISLLPQEAMVAVMCNSEDKGAQARKVCENACIACKKCEKTCPSGAITVVDNLARIDYEKCIRCGKCATVCPTGCLKDVSFPDLPEDFSFSEL